MANDIRVTIAGASGFIGKNLIPEISSKFFVKGLSRSERDSSHRVHWQKADLFSFQSVAMALENTDIAIYLVHSMLPTSRLFQGNFQDTDLFLADNFARACVRNNVKKIIYLGGLVPEYGQSKHLESRKEVEEVLHSTGIPTVILRAGMVVGDGGSSFEILKNLVMNLPVMILPKWTQSQTQAIYIDDLVRVISFCITSNSVNNKTLNVVNGQKITYKELIVKAAKYFSSSKPLFPVPISYTSFSKLWVTIFGNSDYELVSPLIDSLLCDLPSPCIDENIKHLIKYDTFDKMLLEIPKKKSLVSRTKRKLNENTVRSIQRLSKCDSLSVKDVADSYISWLPKHMRNLIIAKWEGHNLNFTAPGLSKPLLSLHLQEEKIELDRVKFHIVGGLLSKTDNTGWLEFRKVSGGNYVLASINNFIPSLPWYIYKYSQALIHLKVMNDFAKYLRSFHKTSSHQ